MHNSFPIDFLREDISQKLISGNRLILKAPTGSGKSTRVPQFILDDVLKGESQVLVLQPRRMAARLLARFIAQERKVELGGEVGYQVRMEGQSGPETRILFVTEGILLRRLFSGDELKGIGALVFDEFHERHLETDLGLGLALILQKEKRPDLKIVVMSATLETSELQEYLHPCTLLETEGKIFPVEIRYQSPNPYETAWDGAVRGLETLMPDFTNGSALVFMPGIYEIRKTIDQLKSKPRFASWSVVPLHSSLSKEEQDEAVRKGERKIIVTTNVAETSITIPGVRCVVDSGLARIARFDARRGINTLYVEPISQSSAGQRAGRAGRTGPGIALRLWAASGHAGRPLSDKPEVLRVDLSEAFLGLLSRGFTDPEKFPWLQKPDPAMCERAMNLLMQLGAVDRQLQISTLGRRMAQLPMHPRFSRMLLLAEDLGCLPAAAVLASLAQSGGIMKNTDDPMILGQRETRFGGSGSDLLFEMNAWLWAGAQQFRQSDCNSLGIHATVARQVAQLASQILRAASGNNRHTHKLPSERLAGEEEENLRRCILAAFSDFIAVRFRMESATCSMMHGKGAQLARESSVQDAGLMVATELEERKTSGGMQLILRKVTSIEEAWLAELRLKGWEEKSEYRYDAESKRVMHFTERSLNGLVIGKFQEEAKDREEISKVFVTEILENRIPFPQWDEKVEAVVRRVNFASLHASYFPIPAIDAEVKSLLIQQSVYSCKSLKDVQRADIWPFLRDFISVDQWKEVDRLAPESIQLPLRKRPTFLRYEENGDVILSETVQALYDCPTNLRIADGKAKLKYEILSPARRPVQITSDLEQFWKTSYLDVKKELKGRYPKHEWR
jgi:ATP-dependent helicase HrpB